MMSSLLKILQITSGIIQLLGISASEYIKYRRRKKEREKEDMTSKEKKK